MSSAGGALMIKEGHHRHKGLPARPRLFFLLSKTKHFHKGQQPIVPSVTRFSLNQPQIRLSNLWAEPNILDSTAPDGVWEKGIYSSGSGDIDGSALSSLVLLVKRLSGKCKRWSGRGEEEVTSFMKHRGGRRFLSSTIYWTNSQSGGWIWCIGVLTSKLSLPATVTQQFVPAELQQSWITLTVQRGSFLKQQRQDPSCLVFSTRTEKNKIKLKKSQKAEQKVKYME